ncbi:MAG: lipoate--protein ligase family protein [Clostridia bacterium]|nr:lipoate--protein ligase family protein [Clostridia bacterium]
MDDSPGTASYNMAVDEAILRHHAQDEVPPTLRFYTWHPPAVSIGYSQDLEREVDREACHKLRIDYVRRPTGGRAVLHDEEITYSVIIKLEYLPGSVLETYKFLSQGLLAGLKQLGLAGELARPKSGKTRGSAACFDAPSWYELEVRGKKLMGSAQMRKQNALLQHGSILLELDISRLLQTMNIKNEKIRQRLADSLEKKATAINPELRKACKPTVTPQEAALGMAKGFEIGLGIKLSPGELTPEEKSTAIKLMEQKYSAHGWNYNRQRGGEQ